MTLRVTRWAIAVAGGLLVFLAIIAGTGSRTATLRQLVIDTLADQIASAVIEILFNRQAGLDAVKMHSSAALQGIW